MPADVVRRGMNPSDILRWFKPDNQEKVIAAKIISRDLQRPFTVIAVADTDFIYDSFWTRSSSILDRRYTVPLLDNGNFILNALESLSGTENLTDLRGKTSADRPFADIEKMRRDNQLQFKLKESEIFEKINQTKAKLSEIWNKKSFEGKAAPPIMQVIIDIFPTNAMEAMLKANMLQIIVFSLFMGIGITAVGDRAKTLYNVFDGLAEVSYKIVGFIMNVAPIGVFGLITPVVAANGPAVLLPLLKVVIAVYLGCFLHAVIVYGGLLKFVGKISPIKFFKAILPAQVLSFTSCSSGGTLPVSMQCIQKLGVSKDISSFVLPLGATINIDGTAVYQGVCALFIAQIYGVDLTTGQYLTIVLTGTLASIGTAGVPGAGFIMLTMILTAIGCSGTPSMRAMAHSYT